MDKVFFFFFLVVVVVVLFSTRQEPIAKKKTNPRHRIDYTLLKLTHTLAPALNVQQRLWSFFPSSKKKKKKKKSLNTKLVEYLVLYHSA